MISSLSSARDLIAANDDRGALAALLIAWRTSHAIEIAELVDCVARRCVLADDVGVKLAGLCTLTLRGLKSRVGSLKTCPDDPRIPFALATLLAEPPFVSQPSRALWNLVLSVLRERPCPRTLALLRTLAGQLAERFGRSMGSIGPSLDRKLMSLLRELEVDVAKLVRPLTADALQHCLQIRALIVDAAPVRRNTADEFLQAISEDPDDDSIRLVFADWLQERGDPRGEFIALQLAKRNQPLAPPDALRERLLLGKYGRTWLGELVRHTLLAENVFERGFIARCRIRHRSARDQMRAIGLREWATVGAVDGGSAELLVHPIMRALYEVRGVSSDVAIALATTPPARRLRSLGVACASYMERVAPVAEALADSALLPALVELELHAARDEDVAPAIRAIQQSPLGMRLEQLIIVRDGDDHASLAANARLAKALQIIVRPA